jgi:NAD(P)H-hydrate epimerase
MKYPELFTAEQARAADEFIQRRIGISALVMMENAGRDCAAVCMERAPSAMRVAVVCGKGNNGGDGFVCARHLAAAGVQADVFLIGRVRDLRPEAGRNWRILRRLNNCGLRLIRQDTVCDFADILKPYNVIVDALFGVGLRSQVEGIYARCIEAVNKSRALVISVDIPSGLDASTGRVLGCCVKAGVTVTFIAAKRGMESCAGKKLCGDIVVSDLGAGNWEDISRGLYGKELL